MSAVPRPARKGGLTPAGEEILRAVMPVVLGSLLPAAREERAEALDEAMWALDDYVSHLSLPLQADARMLMALLSLAPVRLLLLGTTRRWRDAPEGNVAAFLHRTRRSRLYLVRRLFDSLHSMSVIAWFDLPRAWEAIGYPGPPVARPFNEGYEG